MVTFGHERSSVVLHNAALKIATKFQNVPVFVLVSPNQFFLTKKMFWIIHKTSLLSMGENTLTYIHILHLLDFENSSSPFTFPLQTCWKRAMFVHYSFIYTLLTKVDIICTKKLNDKISLYSIYHYGSRSYFSSRCQSSFSTMFTTKMLPKRPKISTCFLFSQNTQ